MAMAAVTRVFMGISLGTGASCRSPGLVEDTSIANRESRWQIEADIPAPARNVRSKGDRGSSVGHDDSRSRQR